MSKKFFKCKPGVAMTPDEARAWAATYGASFAKNLVIGASFAAVAKCAADDADSAITELRSLMAERNDQQ